MRVVFCGSGSFAVPALEAVAASPHEVAMVITQPARPAGRGGKLRATEAAETARRLGLKVQECPNINTPSAVDALQALKADVMCVVDFGQLIRLPARQSVRLDAFNLHGSLLPALRGAAPVNWAIIRGLRRTGVTTFSLVDAMDAGPMYLQEATDIDPQETAEELRHRLAAIGAGLVCRTLDLFARGQAKPQPQPTEGVSLAPRMQKTDGVIHWSAPAETVRNLIHGTWPWPGGQTTLHSACGKQLPVTIARAAVAEGSDVGEAGALDAEGCVATVGGRLRILQLRPAGGKLMTWRDFVNGHRVGAGDRFV